MAGDRTRFGWRRKEGVRAKRGDLDRLRRAIGPRVSICDLIPGRASRLRRWIRPLSSLKSEERRERQECDSARNSEREPRHPAELHSERCAPPPLDFGGAGIGRSTAVPIADRVLTLAIQPQSTTTPTGKSPVTA